MKERHGLKEVLNEEELIITIMVDTVNSCQLQKLNVLTFNVLIM